MISLSCNHCRETIEIDDAFAGGICRCKHCGAIQTVPGKTGKPAAVRTFYTKPIAGEGIPSSGLDQLADHVSRGDSSQFDTQKSLLSRRTILFSVVTVAGIVVVLLIASIAFHGPSTDSNHVVTPVSASPSFCGIPLPSGSVAYVLDCGSGTGENFGYLKEAALKSAATLGSDRQFQIVLWDNGNVIAIPSMGLAVASSENIEAARNTLASIGAHGQSDAIPAVKRAVAAGAQTLILATGKGAQLDDSFAAAVLKALGEKPTVIHVFDIDESQLARPLQQIAARTGGKATLIDASSLRVFARN